MGRIAWNDSFQVGNEVLDKQHQDWVAIYNEFHDQLMQDGDPVNPMGEALAVLDRLIAYCETHFVTEEAFMAERSYEGFAAHKDKHALFLEQLRGVKRQLDAGTYVLSTEIMKMIETWLVNHIIHEDRIIFSLND